MITAGRGKAASAAAGYTSRVLTETGQTAAPVAALNTDRVLATAPDGRSLETLYDEPLIWTKSAVKEGLTAEAALSRAGNLLTTLTLTVLADTRRAVYQADIIRRPALTGYVRMLNPPSCDRCVMLAGKWFRWNEGFLRHPRCDCQHIPAAEDLAGDHRTDPYEYFNSLTASQQNRVFGEAQAQAIRDGGDIYRVTNVRMRGLATAKGHLRYGTPSRITPDDIYRLAGNDRRRAIALLENEGYIVHRGQVAVGFSPGVRTDRQILAAGRGRGTYRVGDNTVITRRAARYDAARTGIRDPLNRATMTSAERRLYDASYRLQYARRNGYVPRSVGPNSADVAAGSRGVRATPDRIAQLEAELARQISRVIPGSSTHRVYLALGLDDEAAAAATFDRITGVTPPRTAAGAGGGDGGRPPRRPGSFDRFDDEPDESDRAAYEAYWMRRQDALGAGDPGELLKRHEIVFYEQLRDADYTIQLLPRGPIDTAGRRAATNDAYIVELGAAVEAKSFRRPKKANVSAEISRAVTAARRNHGVIKDTFIVYSRERPPTPHFAAQLRSYNLEHPDARIERLFLWNGNELVEIDLL